MSNQKFLTHFKNQTELIVKLWLSNQNYKNIYQYYKIRLNNYIPSINKENYNKTY